MAQSFSGRIDLKVTGTYGVDIDLGNRSYSLTKTYTNRFANGLDADEANSFFTDTRTTSGNDDLDLAGGLTDAFGNTITFTSIKGMIIFADADNVGNVLVGAEGTNEFSSFLGNDTDIVKVPPGGMFCITNPAATGFGVTANTGDILRIASSSGSVSYDIILIGEV
jgi:hypothetical protein